MNNLHVTALFLALFCSSALGQNVTAVPAQVAPAAALETLVSRFEGDLRGVADAMPADRYGFSPKELQIHEASFSGTRSFAEQLKHIAWSNYATAAAITGQEPSVTMDSVMHLQGKGDVLLSLSQSFTAVHRAVASINSKNENDQVEDVGIGTRTSRISLAAWVVAHGYDHYGQLVEYLRMVGISPPPSVRAAK